MHFPPGSSPKSSFNGDVLRFDFALRALDAMLF
jgi:hypothetical protein